MMRSMGLNMVVGVLTDVEEEHAEALRGDFDAIGTLLERAGAAPWTEPDRVDARETEFEMWGYSGLHAVRRLAVHLADDGRLPEPLPLGGARATDDPLLREVYRTPPDRGRPGPFDHLVHHSDCEGYYVPVDLPHVIVDKAAPGGYVGSSVRLLAEVREIARALGLDERLDPNSEEVSAAVEADTPAPGGWQRYRVESYVCLQLLHAAELSVTAGSAIALV